MNRGLTASVLAGVVVGAVVAALVQLRLDDLAPRNGESASLGDVDARQSSESAAALGAYANLVAEYAAVAELADADVLASRFEEALQRPASYSSTRVLEALAARLFEIDRSSAARILGREDLPHRLVATLFRAWTRIDAQGAIGLLGGIREPETLRLAAQAIVEVTGDDTIDRIAAEVPALDATSLRAAALAQRARTDLHAALKGVLALRMDGLDHELAIADVGRVAASVDPVAAAAAAATIPGAAPRRAYLTAVYERWSLADVPQFLEHLGALQADELAFLLEGAAERPGLNVASRVLSNARGQGLSVPLNSALALAAESDPERVLEFGRRAGGSLGIVAEAAALEAIAATDPSAATDYLAAVPAGFRRDELIESIANGYAWHDMDAALSWATSLNPPNEQAERAAMTAIAAADLARALRIELADLDTRQGALANAGNIPAWFSSGLVGSLNDPIGIVEQIVAAEENGFWERNMLVTALSRWADADPSATIAWIQANAEEVPGEAMEAVIERLGSLDVEQKLSLAELLPPDKRGDLISNAIGDLVLENPSAALAAAERYRGQPFHERLIISVIGRVATFRGPREAAQMLGTTPPAMAAFSIAQTWAETDPLEAAAWVSGLEPAETRREAVTAVARAWAGRDPAAAVRWVRSLPDASLRERALAMICMRNPGVVDCG